MTLRNRFTVLFVVFAVVITVIGGWLTLGEASRSLEEQMEDGLVNVAELVAPRFASVWVDIGWVRPGDVVPTYDAYRQILLNLVADGYVEAADVFRWAPGDREATVLLTTRANVSIGQPAYWVLPYLDDEVRLAHEWESTATRLEGDHKWGFVRLGDPASVADEDKGTFLGVWIPADYLDPLNDILLRIVALSLTAAALAALIGWRLAGGIVARLETLSRAALRIQRGWMDRPVKLDGQDELGRLARAMERMRTGIQRRDEQLRRMLSQVAHEIRNPLGGLELFAAEAQETDEPEERRRILSRVRKEVMGLNGIIDEFLGFARPGRTEPELHDVRVPVEEATSLVGAEYRKDGDSLQVDFGPGPLYAIADPLQVKRAVLNLLRNAFQAGERVWVKGRMVHGEVCISVEDDGPGIDPQLHDRIFEPFVGNKAQGAGLGLAIVKQLAEANGGRVVLEEPGSEGNGEGGGGAEFHLYLNSPDDLPAGGASVASQRESSTR